jgi:integrase
VATGADPAAERVHRRNAMTVSELADQYLKAAEAGRILLRGGYTKKRTTTNSDRSRIKQHIKPRLGHLKVDAVTKTDIAEFVQAVGASRRGTASRAVGTLGGLFAYAIELGLRRDSPVHGVRRFRDGVRQRRLSDDEYKILGQCLYAAEFANMWPAAIQAIKFIALTGWRRSEALGLRWREIDVTNRLAVLGDTKTGRSERVLSQAAVDVLTNTPRIAGELVFPSSFHGGVMIGFSNSWHRIIDRKLPADVSPHVLRHSFASIAGDLQFADLTIGLLIGHRKRTQTSLYQHAADPVMLAAADRIAGLIQKLMATGRRD